MTETTGINCEPFWDQWINQPGHPVLDYTWAYADGKLSLTVKQTQDTSKGVPVYDLPMKIGYVVDGQGSSTMRTAPVHVTKAEETFEIPLASKPLCVVLDPEHDFLREIPALHWGAEELPYILKFSKNPADRSEAMSRMLDDPTDANVEMVVEAIYGDTAEAAPAFRSVLKLANLKKESLRNLWYAQLASKNTSRAAQAVQALGMLPQDATTTQKLRALVNDKSPIQVVVNAINALAAWDKAGNADLFKKAQGIKDRRGSIKRAADRALGAE
jgi:aminopeptidase N